MSASDAAPLPRLGEVFFDVRGSSRSMRLSWYADTGVAVFSIWQGGMCTGTFRLPMGDLPRMIEILQRGPDQPHRRGRSREQMWGGPEPAGTGQREVPGRLHYPEPQGRHPDEPRTGYSQVDAAETSAVGYTRAEPRHTRDEAARSRPGGYNLAEPAGPPGPGHDRREYEQQPGGAQHGQDEFGTDAYRGYQPLAPREDSAGYHGDDGGYAQERFVPPYVRGSAGDYSSDIPVRPAERLDDPMQEAYRAEPADGPSHDADYPQPSWPPPEYPDGPRYRLPEPAAPHSPGRPGKNRARTGPADEQPDPDPRSGIDSLTRDYPAWPGR